MGDGALNAQGARLDPYFEYWVVLGLGTMGEVGNFSSQ